MHYDIKYIYCINDLKYIFRNDTLVPNNNNTFLFIFVKALQTTKNGAVPLIKHTSNNNLLIHNITISSICSVELINCKKIK